MDADVDEGRVAGGDAADGSGAGGSVARAARARAHREVRDRIAEVARRHLATEGAAALSLRAVARDLGMASSAVYRYVSSRDDLLTVLIVDAFDALGATAEAAHAEAVAAGEAHGTRWLRVCRAVRSWAVDHPHEFALVYGSPVVGYAAPADTVEPATRLGRVLAAVSVDAALDGALDPPRPRLPAPAVVAPGVLALADGVPSRSREDLVERSLVMWIALVGAISFELFGHLHEVVTDPALYFDRAMAVAAAGLGLDVPLPGPPHDA